MAETLSPLVIGLISVSIIALLGLIYWVDSKKKTKEKNDPIWKGIVYTLLIWASLFLAESFGFFEKGWNQEHFYIHIIVAFCLVGIFMFVANRRKPLSYEKQKAIVLSLLDSEYNAETYKGGANISLTDTYRVTIEGDSTSTRGEVGNFWVEAIMAHKVMTFFYQLNIYTGVLLHMQKEPPSEIKWKLIDKKVSVSDEFGSQFDDEEEVEDQHKRSKHGQ